MTIKEAAQVLATDITPSNHTPSRLVSVARVLAKETDGTHDIASIADENKGYGARLRILKALCGTDKVVVKNAEPAKLARELKKVFGAKNAGDLALKCVAMVKAADKAAGTAKKADATAKAAYNKQYAAEHPIHDGKPVLPGVKRLGKKAQAAADAVTRAQVAKEMRLIQEQETVLGFAQPKPEAGIELDFSLVKVLENPVNKIILLQLEKSNSQGAICVYNNGRRVAAGVVPTEVLKSLRQVSCEDLVLNINQLLQPEAGVVVTPVAKRHLTAVLEHCKENIEMANTKKFEATAATVKKSAKKTPAKVAKVKTEVTERKSSLFRLLNDTKATWSAFTTQKAAIVAAFVKLGAVGKTATGVTRAALIAALPDVGAKNVSFYLSKWQAPGIVEKLPAAE